MLYANENRAAGAVPISGGKMRTTTISEEVYDDRNSVFYTEVLNLAAGQQKHKLRVKIRSDFYQEQCFAYVERWSGSTWNKVHTVLDMKTKVGLHGLRTTGPSSFKVDRDELLRVAERVLA